MEEVKKKHKMNKLISSFVILTIVSLGPWYSNIPLRGAKETLYEGGIRAASFVLSPLLKKRGYSYKGFLHLVDWSPTFIKLAGGDIPEDVDGVDIWEALDKNASSPRQQIIHNIDQRLDKGTWQAAMSKDHYKIIWGQETLLKKSQRSFSHNVKLFNIFEDPSETNDVASEFPEIVETMKTDILVAMNKSFVAADYPKGSKSFILQ